jgi:nucleotide-binding universal stress UspA family protein
MQMLTNFKRVLCPVQFDKNSAAALAIAKEIAQQNSGKLFVLYSVSPHADPTRVGGPAMAAHDEKVAEQEMARLKREMLTDVEHEAIIVIGNPAEEIVKAEHEYGVDLVVMATHGRTGVSHLVLGSVAERVVRESVCAVLTIRPK